MLRSVNYGAPPENLKNFRQSSVSDSGDKNPVTEANGFSYSIKIDNLTE